MYGYTDEEELKPDDDEAAAFALAKVLEPGIGISLDNDNDGKLYMTDKRGFVFMREVGSDTWVKLTGENDDAKDV